ncbi:MAG: hypothetical protein NTV68_00545 [Methanomicrobiales archaeon]|nr:hypothetical protein [Methanomicrobiales archaeon]
MPHREIRSNPGLTIWVLNPTATLSDDINQNSIVLKMTEGSVSFLFMDGANANAESGITNDRTNHPGRYPQNQAPRQRYVIQLIFLRNTHPKISINDVGAGNSYDHPTSATLMAPGPGGVRCIPHQPGIAM